MNHNLENLLQCAVELLRELMLQTSLNGEILETNPAWTHMLGWNEPDLCNKSFFDLVHPADLEKTREHMGQLTGSARAFINRFRHKDGSFRSISWLFIARGKYLYATGLDVTAEKDALAALSESQLSVTQLHKMHSIVQLTSGLAHDLNNSLQNVMAALELVRKLIEAGRAAETGRFITSALASAHGAAGLNQRLAQFSRRQPFDPKPLAINDLITGMEEIFRRSLPNSIKLDLDLAAGLWETRCDASEAETALLNLALNARDAMPDGGVLKIQTSNAAVESKDGVHPAILAAGQYVCVAVTDSGTGMISEITEHAFDAFFTTKPKKMAIGLGLTMVRRFARQNEGDAKIESEIGRGTLVAFYLPRYRSPEPTDGKLN